MTEIACAYNQPEVEIYAYRGTGGALYKIPADGLNIFGFELTTIPALRPGGSPQIFDYPGPGQAPADSPLFGAEEGAEEGVSGGACSAPSDDEISAAFDEFDAVQFQKLRDELWYRFWCDVWCGGLEMARDSAQLLAICAGSVNVEDFLVRAREDVRISGIVDELSVLI
jgi:hypothetical protein